jgi:hypothetical protein
MLERRLPAEFSQPQVQLSMPVNVEYKELSVVLEELKQCPEARCLLPPEMFDMFSPNSEPSTTEGKESAPVPEAKPMPEDFEQKQANLGQLLPWINSLQNGPNVTNQERPIQGSSSETERMPGAEK